MKIYESPLLKITLEQNHNRFINYWKESPKNITEFRAELLNYLRCLEKHNPTQIIWLQLNFKLIIDDDTKLWVEKNILIPRFKAGFIKADRDGFHPIAFVVGKSVLSHMEVMGVFDEPNPSVFKPRHFATEKEARNWLDEDLFENPTAVPSKPEIEYKGLDENGKAIIEFKKPSTEIVSTIKTFKTLIEENNFVKENVDKFSSLTKREKEVLIYLAKGEVHKIISDKLFISVHTVKEHWKNIKRKLDVKSDNELIKYWNAFYKK